MASSHRNVGCDNAKMEQIVTEFFAKSLHIILEARDPLLSSRNFSGDQTASSSSFSSSSSSSYRPRDKWFNLALHDCPDALENVDVWRPSNLEPMIVDVILVDRRALGREPADYFPKGIFYGNLSASEQKEYELDHTHEKVIERWMVKYECGKSRNDASRCKSSTNLSAFYKKSILLLRSLYSMVRLLPAYKLFRDITLSGLIRAFALPHRLRSFMEPLSRTEETDMQCFRFTPIESSSDRLSVSVSYRPSVSGFCSEPSALLPFRLIPDYFKCPLVEPLKGLTSLPTSQASPSYSPVTRHHTSTFDNFDASPQSNYPSPFPAYPDSSASASRTQYPPPSSLPPERTPARISSVNHPITGSTLKQHLPPPSPVRHTSHGDGNNDRSSSKNASVAGKFTNGRDESGRLSGEKLSSNSLPRISFSRRSSRLELDKTEFACPFVVDEDDMMDPGCRPESRDQNEPYEAGRGLSLGRQSQGAALGALVQMLNDASPLHQDMSNSSMYFSVTADSIASNVAQDCSSEDRNVRHAAAASNVACTGQLTSKTAALVLEELQCYREMKESLLKKGSRSMHGRT